MVLRMISFEFIKALMMAEQCDLSSFSIFSGRQFVDAFFKIKYAGDVTTFWHCWRSAGDSKYLSLQWNVGDMAIMVVYVQLLIGAYLGENMFGSHTCRYLINKGDDC